MNLGLLAPLGLAAMSALLLPILLHLQRRTPGQRTDFAALRWIRARLRPRRRLRVDEPWLLLVRLLLVACVALLFAQPVWTARGAGAPWVLVHPAVAADAARAAVADASEGARWHWLAPGFPGLDEAPGDAAGLPVASLLREADASLPADTALTLVLPAVIAGLDAERPRLSRRPRWVVVATPEPPPARAATTTPGALAIRGSAVEGRRYLVAAARASGRRVDEAAADVAPPADVAAAVWLDEGAPPAALLDWARAGGTLWLAASQPPIPDARAAWRDTDGSTLVLESPLERGRLLQWQRPLQPEDFPELLEPGFAAGFDRLLRPPSPVPDAARADSLRPRLGGPSPSPPPRPVDSWLAWGAIALLLVERLLATRAQRLRDGEEAAR